MSIFYTLIGFYFLVFAIISFKRMERAVFLILFLLPSYQIRFNLFGIPLTLLEGMILISFSVWLFKNRREVCRNIKMRFASLRSKEKRADFVPYPFDREIILILLIAFLVSGVAVFSNSALGVFKAYFFEPILLYILIFNVHFKKEGYKGFEQILRPLFYSAFAISLLAIYQKLTGNFIFNEFWANEETRRVTSFFAYPNAVGLFLGPIMLLMIGRIIEEIGERRKVKGESLFLILNFCLSLLAIYFAKSEGAIIGILAGALVMMLFASRFWRRVAIILVVVGVITFGGMSYLVYENSRIARGEFGSGVSQKIPGITKLSGKVIGKLTLKDLSGEIRKQQWRETFQMFNEKPIRWFLGTGLSGYQSAVLPFHQEGIFFNKDNDPDFRRKIVIFDDKYKAGHWQPVEVYMYPHNIVLNFWTELGLIGVLIFGWLIFKFYVSGSVLIKKSPSHNIGDGRGEVADRLLLISLLGAMTVIVVHGLVDVPYFKNDLSILFWVIAAGMGYNILENRKR